jgi:hypothetical protein
MQLRLQTCVCVCVCSSVITLLREVQDTRILTCQIYKSVTRLSLLLLLSKTSQTNSNTEEFGEIKQQINYFYSRKFVQ